MSSSSSTKQPATKTQTRRCTICHAKENATECELKVYNNRPLCTTCARDVNYAFSRQCDEPHGSKLQCEACCSRPVVYMPRIDDKRVSLCSECIGVRYSYSTSETEDIAQIFD